MINEDQVEQLAIEWFKELGYDYLHGYDIAPDSSTPERNSYQEVLLSSRLRTAKQAEVLSDERSQMGITPGQNLML